MAALVLTIGTAPALAQDNSKADSSHVKEKTLNELVIVGYGTQRRGNLVGTVSQVSGDVLENRSNPNVARSLQGEIPGLTITMADGKPIRSGTNYYSANALLTFTPKLGTDHHVKVLGGWNLENEKYITTRMDRQHLLVRDKPNFNLADGDSWNIRDNGSYSWGFVGAFYRLNYDYKSRYLFETSGRYDGTSKFPQDQQWGFFPSADARFVFYSVPSAYKASSTKFYQKLSATTERYDFSLTPLASAENSFYLLALADPQVRNNAQLQRFQQETLPDIEGTLSTLDKPVYGICLGDIADEGHPEMESVMRKQMQWSQMPMFPCIGNHDKVKQTDATLPRTTTDYEREFGPLNYSFNRGRVHFVSMDDLVFQNGTDYVAGFSDAQVAWLRSDLQYVPKDWMVILYYHIPLRNDASIANRDAILSLLDGYAEVHLMCGHTHYNRNYAITDPISVEERIHGAGGGAWWNSKICGDGTPNGYAIYQITGNSITNLWYKSTGYDRAFQLRLFHGNATFEGQYGRYGYELPADYIVANVWNADPLWKISVYEDGVYSGDMTAAAFHKDAWAAAYLLGELNKNPEYYNPYCSHDFVYHLKNPRAAVRVEARDEFGNVYTQEQFTTDLSEAH